MLCFAFRSGELLVEAGEGRVALPGPAFLEAVRGSVLRELAIGELDGERCVAVELSPDAGPGGAIEARRLRAVHGLLPPSHYRMAGRAAHLLDWDRTHRFCGQCGTPTEPGASEHARRCPRCGLQAFPRIAPAVIVRIHDGDRLLLCRSPHFREGMYSNVAGFVEAGESLEEAVAREVREEVGIEIRGLRYFGSQPWPYPNSLMIAFTAERAAGELRPDPAEIEDAAWFGPRELPMVPAPLSIARALIDDFVREHGVDPRSLRTST